MFIKFFVVLPPRFGVYDEVMKRTREPVKAPPCPAPECGSPDTRLIQTFPGQQRWQCNDCGQKFHCGTNPDGTSQLLHLY